MRIVYKRCCGMDVHKDSVTVCLLIIEDDGEFRTEKRRFGIPYGTFWRHGRSSSYSSSTRSTSSRCRGEKRIRKIVNGSQICCSMVF
jgi:hypothetical protein